MTTKLDSFLASIEDSAKRLVENTKRATRIGIIGVVGLTVGCSVEVKDDFYVRLRVVDAATGDTQDGSVVNPSDIIGLDASTMDISPMDSERGDSQITDASMPTDAVMASDTPDASTPADVVMSSDTPDASMPTDAVMASDSPDASMPTDVVMASDTPDASTPADVVMASDTPDAGMPTDAVMASDTPDASTPADVVMASDTPDASDVTDASIGTRFVTGPSSAGIASCNRVNVVGIAGCTPGATACEYNTNVGGPLRYYIDTVTTGAGYPAAYSYEFASFFNTPISRSFSIPDTGNFTPTVTSGSFTVQANVVSGPSSVTRCYGPRITIVTR